MQEREEQREIQAKKNAILVKKMTQHTAAGMEEEDQEEEQEQAEEVADLEAAEHNIEDGKVSSIWCVCVCVCVCVSMYVCFESRMER